MPTPGKDESVRSGLQTLTRLRDLGIYPMRTLVHLFGWLCFTIAVLLGLFALFGYLANDVTGDHWAAAFVGAVAFLLFIFGLRAIQFGKQRNTAVAPSTTHRDPHLKTGLHYDTIRWGDPPPSRKQFGYAVQLGAQLRDGMTRWMLSDAIDEAIEKQRDDEPATREQLRTIKEYHGVLPRSVTRGEAKRVIEFLEDHYQPCPFCGIDVFATDEQCCACNKNLSRMKIPIEL